MDINGLWAFTRLTETGAESSEGINPETSFPIVVGQTVAKMQNYRFEGSNSETSFPILVGQNVSEMQNYRFV